MKLWVAAPVLAAAFLGGTSIAVAGQAATGHSASHHRAARRAARLSAAQASPAPSPSPTAVATPVTAPAAATPVTAPAAATPLALPPSSPAPALTQVGSQRWQTTLLLTDTQPACRQKARYWLETTPRTRAVARAGRPRQVGKPSRAAGVPSGSSCQVTLTFTKLRGIPVTAALVLDQAGTLATIPLTVSREVTLTWYLWIPLSAGGAMALAVLLFCLLFVRVYRDGDRIKPWPIKAGFWKRPLTASGAWTANDSWATNITALLALIGTVLGTTTAASVLFPGVALDRFALLNIAAGGVIVATPLLFGVLYGWFTGRAPGPTADATILLPPAEPRPPDGQQPPDGGQPPGKQQSAEIYAPAGASIAAAGGANVWQAAEYQAGAPPGNAITVQPGKAITVPPGCRISVLPEAQLTIPGGTSDIAVYDGGALRISLKDATGGQLIIPAGDRVVPARRTRFQVPRRPRAGAPASTGSRACGGAAAGQAIGFPVMVTGPGGLKITVTGTADVTLPAKARIDAPQHKRGRPLPAPRELQTPQSSGVMVASLGLVLAAAVVTAFGTGAELGLAGVLAVHLSAASHGWHLGLLLAFLAVGTVMLTYSVSAVSSLVNPVPGSSTSAASGTSFTL